MPEENVEIVHRVVEAFMTRDVEGAVACFDEGAELLLARNLLEGGSYRGYEGVRQAIADSFETWEDLRFEIEQTRTAGDFVVVLIQATAVGKAEMPTSVNQLVLFFEVREGAIVYARPYASHREALEAAGLSA